MLAVVAVTVSGMLQPAVDTSSSDEPADVSAARIVPPAPAIDARPSFDALRELVQTIPALPAAESQGAAERDSAEAAEVLSAITEAVPRSAGGVQDPVEGIEKAAAQVQADSEPATGSAPVMPEAPAQAPAPQAVVPEPVTTAAANIPSAPTAISAPRNEPRAGSAVAPEPQSDRSGPAARRIAFRAPEFPQDARLEGIEGWVRFTYTIGRNGYVSDVRIVDAQPRYVFEQAVKRAVRQWRFEPVLQDGVPVERDVTQTIEFALGKANNDEETRCEPGTGTRLCRKKEAQE